ncbi:CaiB/BaiF CoA-transferase family protein [Burkholderia sp. S171]|uniref:CaiB/BaiF CoA-transferase family protein n=1 Tax=Burkholderia sp. S171 TaxID=1641860 RepID=UPI00265CD3C0|nr:CaiB/BaiF CoA-transferase family protein [Burkholderia sp. S171]
MATHSLAGIQVVNFGLNLPGPMLAARLAERGAVVLHIEPPDGDPTRRMFLSDTGEPLLHRELHLSSQIKSLDLRDEAQRSEALSLCATADIIIDSFLPGTLSRLGIDAERLRHRNPRLIYCSIVGFRTLGTRSDLPGHDINFLAASGVAASLGLTPDGTLPVFLVGDIVGGVLCSEIEILAALIARTSNGRGAHISISITEALRDLNIVSRLREKVPKDNSAAFMSGTYPCYRLYTAADNTTLALGALETKFWRRFCDLIDRSDLVSCQFATREDSSSAHAAVETALLAHDASYWETRSMSAPCCLTAILKN